MVAAVTVLAVAVGQPIYHVLTRWFKDTLVALRLQTRHHRIYCMLSRAQFLRVIDAGEVGMDEIRVLVKVEK